MRYVLILALTILASAVQAQSTRTFPNYVNGLPTAGIVSGSETIYMIQSGVSKKATISQLPGSITGSFTAGDVLVANASGNAVDTLHYGFNGGTSLNPASIPAYNNCFWNVTDSCTTVNVRMRERVFIGNAVNQTDNRSNCCNNTWMPTTNAPGYLPRDAQLSVMHDRGGVAIFGGTRASDGNAPTANSPIGVSGYALNNSTAISPLPGAAWASYFQCDWNPPGVTTTACYGIEVDTVNYGPNETGQPYGIGSGTYGLWIASGGGQNPTNPSNAAIVIQQNTTTWNNGIVFVDGSLTPDVNGNVDAILLPKGGKIEWFMSGGAIAAKIVSEVDIGGRDLQLVFFNNLLSFEANGTTHFMDFTHTPTGVNGLNFVDNVTGSAPIIKSFGADSVAGLDLSTKSTGVIRIYPGADVAAAFSVQNAALNKTYISVDTTGNNVSLPQVTTGTPAATLCIDASNNIIKATGANCF